ncbi:hypothetical protein [Methylocystis sp.]|uniref:hypothetical protein n=1 Tax=Methylocystis sp. TaxID=1911079 RepID=UPI003DA2F109
MKTPALSTPIEELLLEEVQDREALALDYYRGVKQASIDHALTQGVAPDVVERLYGMTLKND